MTANDEQGGGPAQSPETGETFRSTPFASAYEQRVAEARAMLEQTRTEVARAESELRRQSVTLRSKDHSVQVTVGPQGELTDLKFLDGKYRNMGAAELASNVMSTLARARGQMSRRVVELFQPLTQTVANVPELPGVSIDWEKIFGAGILDDPEDETTDRARRGRPPEGGTHKPNRTEAGPQGRRTGRQPDRRPPSSRWMADAITEDPEEGTRD
ncbi:YbaB/EbfC family nucleoid-associated protein [Streptomyces sp. NPDC093675]|uniref:YbaB/EbfC family nucleoid-associated protein n=1 Tax=Streptomyces sp. NPDC093675 TaxID=3366049 RepID=UPI0038264E54